MWPFAISNLKCLEDYLKSIEKSFVVNQSKIKKSISKEV